MPTAMELVTPPSTDPIAELAKTIGIVLCWVDINAAFVVWSVHGEWFLGREANGQG
jgi:hypothetical protein